MEGNTLAIPSHACTGCAPCVVTSEYLVFLLSSRTEYRRRWQAFMRRQGPHAIHQGAVAHVLASYLWDSGEIAETDIELPRRLKDVVSRALHGRVLAPTTLKWFIEAFAMSPNDSGHLWALRYGQHLPEAIPPAAH